MPYTDQQIKDIAKGLANSLPNQMNNELMSYQSKMNNGEFDKLVNYTLNAPTNINEILTKAAANPLANPSDSKIKDPTKDPNWVNAKGMTTAQTLAMTSKDIDKDIEKFIERTEDEQGRYNVEHGLTDQYIPNVGQIAIEAPEDPWWQKEFTIPGTKWLPTSVTDPVNNTLNGMGNSLNNKIDDVEGVWDNGINAVNNLEDDADKIGDLIALITSLITALAIGGVGIAVVVIIIFIIYKYYYR